MSGYSGRYARALFQVGSEEGDGREFRYGELLAAFTACLAQVPTVRQFLAGAQVNKSRKKKYLGELFADADDSRFLSFLKVLVDKNRMDIIDLIGLEYRRLELDARNIREALIESAFPLDAETVARVRAVFKEKTGAGDIRSTVRIVPELVGGIRVTVGSSVYDGTTRSGLDRLCEQMKKAGVDHGNTA